MADVYIYSGPTQLIKPQSGKPFNIYDGEYIFYTGSQWGYPSTGGSVRLHTFVCYNGETRNEWTTVTDGDHGATVPNPSGWVQMGTGKIATIRQANFLKYGSGNKHAASGGGCMYTIQSPCGIYHSSGSHITDLKPGDVVIIGAMQPHGKTGSYNRIRMWGFKRGGRGGADVETTDCYIDSKYTSSIAHYSINTK